MPMGKHLKRRHSGRKPVVALGLFLLAPLAVRAQWGLTWDLRARIPEEQDTEIISTIRGALQQAGGFYESEGFAKPYLADAACKEQNPVPVVDLVDFEPFPYVRTIGSDLIGQRDLCTCDSQQDFLFVGGYCEYYRACRRELVHRARSAELWIESGGGFGGQFRRYVPHRKLLWFLAEPEFTGGRGERSNRRLQVEVMMAAHLFEAVMNGSDWYRENASRAWVQTDYYTPFEFWFVDAMALAAAGRVYRGEGVDLAHIFLPRAYNYPLHLPLGKKTVSMPDAGRASDEDCRRSGGSACFSEFEAEGLLTAQLWAHFIDFFGMDVLKKAITDEWRREGAAPGWPAPEVDKDVFFLDTLDAALHGALRQLAADANVIQLNSPLSRFELFLGLCRPSGDGTEGTWIEKLSLEAPSPDGCDHAVGGLHFAYPMALALMTEELFQFERPQYQKQMAEAEWPWTPLERMYPQREGRDHPDGCIRMTTGYDATLTLDIDRVAAECVVLEELASDRGPLAVVWAESKQRGAGVGLSLAWDGCFHQGELLEFDDGSWARYWHVDRDFATSAVCNQGDRTANGNKVALVFTNVGLMASRTAPIEDLKVTFFPPDEIDAQ